jgi:hypothetical protein
MKCLPAASFARRLTEYRILPPTTSDLRYILIIHVRRHQLAYFSLVRHVTLDSGEPNLMNPIMSLHR